MVFGYVVIVIEGVWFSIRSRWLSFRSFRNVDNVDMLAPGQRIGGGRGWRTLQVQGRLQGVLGFQSGCAELKLYDAIASGCAGSTTLRCPSRGCMVFSE